MLERCPGTPSRRTVSINTNNEIIECQAPPQEILTRFKIKINYWNSNVSALHALWVKLVEMINKLQQYDRMVKILPWRSKADGTNPMDLQIEPPNLGSLNRYTSRLRAQTDASNNEYRHLRISHSQEYKDLLEGMKDWLRDIKHGLYYQRLQEESIKPLGWFLYSTKNSIDWELLHQSFYNSQDIRLDFSYHGVSLGSRKDAGTAYAKVMALHVY